MPFDKKTASDAAKKRWEKQRQLALDLPDYGTSGPLPAAPTGKDQATDLPATTNLLAGGIADWDDDIYSVDDKAYALMRSCPAIVAPIKKLALRTAALDLVVVGEGARAEAVQEIIDQARGIPEMIEWMTWARLEGYRVNQIRKAATREGGSDIWVVPDLTGGGRKKQKAGGTVAWDGTRLVEIQQNSGNTTVEARLLPKEEFIVFRPGAGSNPEGDLELGMACYRVAYNWNEAFKNMDAYVELFGLPTRIIKRKLDKARPTQVNSLLTDAAARLAAMQQDKNIALSDEDIIELLEPKGKGLEDLASYMQYLEGLVQQMVLLNTLTSDTKESGAAGSSMVHLSEEDQAVWYNGFLIAEALNEQLLPWIIDKNPDLPDLEGEESEVYLMFQRHGQRDNEDETVTDETGIDSEVAVPGILPGQNPVMQPAAPQPQIPVEEPEDE